MDTNTVTSDNQQGESTFVTGIECNRCKMIFSVDANDHLNGIGCPRCDNNDRKPVKSYIFLNGRNYLFNGDCLNCATGDCSKCTVM